MEKTAETLKKKKKENIQTKKNEQTKPKDK